MPLFQEREKGIHNSIIQGSLLLNRPCFSGTGKYVSLVLEVDLGRPQNSPCFCLFKYARANSQTKALEQRARKSLMLFLRYARSILRKTRLFFSVRFGWRWEGFQSRKIN